MFKIEGKAEHQEPLDISLKDLVMSLKPHDHVCLIYETHEEWLEAIVPYFLTGLQKGEKCLYIVDVNTAEQIRKVFNHAGIDVSEAEAKGRLAILHERDTYTRKGYFDPDLMIKLLISETEKALEEGYPALRVSGEMSWALRGHVGSDKLLEYEAKLNRDFFPQYPCLSICQYDRWKFDSEIIKGVVLTHPFLIRGSQIYRNFYYIEPEEYLNHKKYEREVQHWLNNLERERKNQESIRASEKKLSTLFAAMTEIVVLHEIVFDRDGNPVDYLITDCNKAFTDLTGIEREDAVGGKATKVYQVQDPPYIKDYSRVVATGKPCTFETFYAPLDKHLLISAAFLGDNRFATITSDITELKQIENNLKSEQKEKELILENLTEQVAYLDLDMRLLWANKRVEERHGIAPDVYLGRKCYEVYHHLDNPCPDCPILDTFKHGIPKTGIHQSIDDSYWKMTGVPIHNDQGELVGVLDTALEITELKKTEKELLALNTELEKRVKERTEELEMINRELDAFTYSVSHDLRGPLRRIKGFSEIIMEDFADQLNEQGKEYLSRINASTKSMNETIEDLLKLSRVSRHEIDNEIVDLSSLVKKHLSILREKDVDRFSEIIIEPKVFATGDASLLRIAVENLLDNAWKYTAGEKIAVIEFGVNKQNGKSIYYLKDNGAGFNMQYGERLFKPFQRLHSEKDYPGTGIGLSIVSRIINRHDGDIWAESEEGKGAAFFFTLPD